MTLEEAKERIKQAAEESRRDYYLYEDEQLKGEEFGLITALSILKHVDTEPAQKDKMTLAELAHELRKIFKFKYLTKDPVGNICCWNGKPVYDAVEDFWVTGSRGGVSPVLETWPSAMTVKTLDLSEYKDENGEIDYSKCIGEVE